MLEAGVNKGIQKMRLHFVIPKVCYSEGSLFRKLVNPNRASGLLFRILILTLTLFYDFGITGLIVYGAMSKKWLLRVFLLYFNFLGYFASSNPPLPESSCRQFSPLHAWLPFRIQNGRFIQFFTGIEKSS